VCPGILLDLFLDSFASFWTLPLSGLFCLFLDSFALLEVKLSKSALRKLAKEQKNKAAFQQFNPEADEEEELEAIYTKPCSSHPTWSRDTYRRKATDESPRGHYDLFTTASRRNHSHATKSLL
jgi:hypothetical protein